MEPNATTGHPSKTVGCYVTSGISQRLTEVRPWAARLPNPDQTGTGQLGPAETIKLEDATSGDSTANDGILARHALIELTWQPSPTWEPGRMLMAPVRLSLDGSKVLAAAQDGSVLVWSLPTGDIAASGELSPLTTPMVGDKTTFGYGSIVAGRSSFYVWRDNGCLAAALANTCVLVSDPSFAGLPVLAPDALDQPLRTSLLGRHTGLAFWHWRISLTILGALAALTTWHLVTRRRHPCGRGMPSLPKIFETHRGDEAGDRDDRQVQPQRLGHRHSLICAPS